MSEQLAEMELELQLLGPFAAVYGEQALDSFRSNKIQALFAYLATEAAFREEARGHGREQLMTLLWPGMPHKSAQVNLRQVLYQLRQMVPELPPREGQRPVPFLFSDRQQVQVNPVARYRLDVARFLRLLSGEPGPEGLAEAVALYRGPFLSDFYLPDSERYEEWAGERRARLQR